MQMRWMVMGAAAAMAGIGFVLWDQRATFGSRSVFPPVGVTKFPEVMGTNLARQPFTLPGDLEGSLNVLMVAFKQHHQEDVNTWLPLAQDLAVENDQVRYYELPTIARMNPISRSVVDNGMRAGIPDPVARHTTITLYLDKPAFMRSLDIPTDDQIHVLLVDREGNVLWRIAGRHTDAAEASLRSAIAAAADMVQTPPGS
jgi:hypothetical protein